MLEFFAITEKTTEETRPECDSAGPIGDFRIESKPDQNRKGQQRSAAGNGIDRTRRKRSAEHDKHGEETHRLGLELRPHVNIKTHDSASRAVCSPRNFCARFVLQWFFDYGEAHAPCDDLQHSRRSRDG